MIFYAADNRTPRLDDTCGARCGQLFRYRLRCERGWSHPCPPCARRSCTRCPTWTGCGFCHPNPRAPPLPCRKPVL